MQRLKPTKESNLIFSIGYDPKAETLELRLKNKDKTPGKIYQYLKVPMEKFRAFVDAPSMGKYYLVEIKPKHECVKVEDAKEEKENREETGTDEGKVSPLN